MRENRLCNAATDARPKAAWQALDQKVLAIVYRPWTLKHMPSDQACFREHAEEHGEMKEAWLPSGADTVPL